MSKKEVFVTVQRIGFTFQCNERCYHNLMSPAFLGFFKEDDSSVTSIDDEQQKVEEYCAQSTDAFPPPEHLHHFSLAGVYKVLGRRIILCSDKRFRKCQEVRFSFQIDGKRFNEIFFIDKSLWRTLHASALLGSAFAKKHRQKYHGDGSPDSFLTRHKQ